MTSDHQDGDGIPLPDGPLNGPAGGEVVTLRVHGGLSGDTFLVMENPDFHSAAGSAVISAVSGGRAKVE